MVQHQTLEAALETDLHLDLEVDRVLSASQVERHYGLSPAREHGLILFDVLLSRTQHSQEYRRTTFVTLERKVTRFNAASIRHLAGVAEMRRLLSAPRTSWRSEASARYAAEVPDALWSTPAGEVAVEYDAGSYSPRQILAKALTFRRYEKQIWGSPSRLRAKRLTVLLQGVSHRTGALFAPWD